MMSLSDVLRGMLGDIELPPADPSFVFTRDAMGRITNTQASEPVCPACNGIGRVRRDVPVNHPDFGKAFPCAVCADERAWRLAEKILANAGVDEFSGMNRDTFVQVGGDVSLLQRGDEWLKQLPFGDGAIALYLFGKVGRGKSWFATELLKTWVLANGFPARFLVVPLWLQSLRPGLHSSEEQKAQARTAALTIPFLVLDDIGSETPTTWVSEQLFEVIQERKAHRLTTVFTSNIGPDVLEERWTTDARLTQMEQLQGLRILERMLEMCGRSKWVVEVGGRNLRKDARQSAA